jgi:hypothetical protein
MTTAANAQFTAKHSMPDYIRKECMVAKVTTPDHDRDPGYMVNVWADLTGGYPNKLVAFDAIHTMASGKEYHRSEQYTNATLRLDNNVIQWTGWWHNEPEGD